MTEQTATNLYDVAKASVRGSFFLFLGNTLSTIVLAITSIAVARLLGPEDYGLYVVAMIAPTLLIALSDVGISPALTRYSALFRAQGKDRQVLALIKAGLLFKLTLSVLLSLVLLLLSGGIATWALSRPEIDYLVGFTALCVLGQGLLVPLNSVFTGIDRMEHTSLLMIVNAIAKALASPLLIVFGLGAVGAILGTGIAFLLSAAAGVALLLLRIRPVFCTGKHGNSSFHQALRLMIPYGMPLYLSNIVMALISQYGTFVLTVFVSDTQIGNYKTALNFSTIIALVSYPIVTALFPAFSKLSAETDHDTIEKMFRFSVKYTSLLVIPSSLALALFSNELVQILYGLQFQQAPAYLAIYILNFLCAGMGMFVVKGFFNGQGDTQATFRMNLLKLGLTVPLAFVLTALYGVIGLLITVFITELLSTTYGLNLARKKYKVTLDIASTVRTFAVAISTTLLSCLFLASISFPNPAYKLVLGGTFFLTLLLTLTPLLGAIDKEDLQHLHELLKGIPPVYLIAKPILNLEQKLLRLTIKHQT